MSSSWTPVIDPSIDACLTLVRIVIAQRDSEPLAEALRVLDKLAHDAEAASLLGVLIELHVLRALVLQAQNAPAAALAYDDPPGAQAALGRALALAAPEGYLRLFLDEGEPMLALLRVAARFGANTAYAARLLDAFALEPGADSGEERPLPEVRGTTAEGQRAIGAALPTLVELLIEPLSERELEVLRLKELWRSSCRRLLSSRCSSCSACSSMAASSQAARRCGAQGMSRRSCDGPRKLARSM